MSLVEQWDVLGCELVLRDNSARLVVQHKESGRSMSVDPKVVRLMAVGGGVVYSAGWLAGAVAVLSGEVNGINLLEMFSCCANDDLGEGLGTEMVPGG